MRWPFWGPLRGISCRSRAPCPLCCCCAACPFAGMPPPLSAERPLPGAPVLVHTLVGPPCNKYVPSIRRRLEAPALAPSSPAAAGPSPLAAAAASSSPPGPPGPPPPTSSSPLRSPSSSPAPGACQGRRCVVQVILRVVQGWCWEECRAVKGVGGGGPENAGWGLANPSHVIKPRVARVHRRCISFAVFECTWPLEAML